MGKCYSVDKSSSQKVRIRGDKVDVKKTEREKSFGCEVGVWKFKTEVSSRMKVHKYAFSTRKRICACVYFD